MDKQAPDEECATCTAWKPIEQSGTGHCRAHPPVPLFGAAYGQPGSGQPQATFHFPITGEVDWCREYRKITEPSPI